jgi:ABC-type uncharacterized transport system permease subunit
MKRKAMLAILGVVAALLVFLQQTFGLSLDAAGFSTALGVVVLYIFFEAKRDIEIIKQQKNKWTDPKSWIAFIVVILTAINSGFGLNIPVDIINAVLGIILSILFKAKVATT